MMVAGDIKTFETAYAELYDACARTGFQGFDPFDGLNSRVFSKIPGVARFASLRLAYLQLLKRSRFDLRGPLRVPPGLNPKTLALFALAEFSRFRSGSDPANLERGLALLAELKSVSFPTPGGGVAWGYNFDWQSRAFYAPRGTPTVVPTAFATFAFIDAFELTSDQEHLDTAELVCRFITEDLNRPIDDSDALCFSYTPLDQSVIYNASLLAGEVLAKTGTLSANHEWIELGKLTARLVCRDQRPDGSWPYGPALRHGWVDSFHTAYILKSLSGITTTTGSDICPEDVLSKGIGFWTERFFLDDGTPRYYASRTYPIDIHSAAAAIAVLAFFADKDRHCFDLARKVAAWTLTHMRSESGGFIYRINRYSRGERVFIRWGNAWMAYALAALIEALAKDEETNEDLD